MSRARSLSGASHPLAYSPTHVHKGMRNSAGENNCFLNVTIQALWHIGKRLDGIIISESLILTL
jgi:hypothetical protein